MKTVAEVKHELDRQGLGYDATSLLLATALVNGYQLPDPGDIWPDRTPKAEPSK